MKNRFLKTRSLFLMLITVFSICAVSVGLLMLPRTSAQALDDESSALASDPVVLSSAEDFTYSEDLGDGTVAITGLAEPHTGETLSLTLPSQSPDNKPVSKIADRAFYRESDSTFVISSITLPTGLKSIGSYAFAPKKESYTTSLPPMYLPRTSAKYYTHSFSTIEIPETVTEIGDHAFYCCTRLKTVTFSETSQLQTIGPYAFAGDHYDETYQGRTSHYAVENSISTIKIPASVTEIGDHAFFICANLETVEFDQEKSQLKTIGPYAFAGYMLSFNKIDSTTMGGTPTADPHPNKISTITIPKSVIEIGDHAFSDCYNLTTVNFGQDSQDVQLTTIGDYAFAGRFFTSNTPYYGNGTYHSNQLSTINIPKSVTKIGNHAFEICENLETVNFEPGSLLESIGDYAFACYPGDSSAKVLTTNKLSTITIPKNVTKIGSHAFFLNENLETVNFESDSLLESIGDEAFAGNVVGMSYALIWKTNKLSTITIPKNVTEIGSSAFYLNVNLETVNFEPGSLLESIGDFAFASSSGSVPANEKLSTIEIPNGVTEIAKATFANCKALATINLDNITSIGERAFENTGFTGTLTIPETVQTIGAKAFSSCENLQGVQLPNGVTEIADSTFANCTNLATINLDNITNFGASALQGTALSGQLIINDAVQTIGSKAFSGCASLDLVVLPNKEKFDAFKSGFDADKATYVINISFNPGSGVTRTDKKLFKKDLNWANVEGVWQSEQDYALEEGTWLLEGEEVDLDALNTKFTSGQITDDIVLTLSVPTVNRVEGTDGIYATSEAGVPEGVTLKVEVIEDPEQIQAKLSDLSENVKKLYVIELQQDGQPYAEAEDLVIHFPENLAGEFGVYLFDTDLKKQTAADEEFTFNMTSCTIALRDDTIREITKDNFTAKLQEGFPEDVTMTVTKYTAKEDFAQFEGINSDLTQEVVVVELKQADAAFTSESVTITVPATFAGELEVKLLQDGQLVDCTAEEGTYSFTGTKLVLVLQKEEVVQPGDDDHPERPKTNSTVWIIVGCVLGFLLILLVLLVVFLEINRQRRKRKMKKEQMGDKENK